MQILHLKRKHKISFRPMKTLHAIAHYTQLLYILPGWVYPQLCIRNNPASRTDYLASISGEPFKNIPIRSSFLNSPYCSTYHFISRQRTTFLITSVLYMNYLLLKSLYQLLYALLLAAAGQFFYLIQHSYELDSREAKFLSFEFYFHPLFCTEWYPSTVCFS